MIHLLIVASEPSISKGLQINLCAELDFEVAGVAENLDAMHILAQQLNPDVVIVDMDMPGMNKFEAVYCLRSLVPGAKVVFLSHHEDAVVQSHIRSLHAAFVLKSLPANTLITTIREVLQPSGQKSAGGIFF